MIRTGQFHVCDLVIESNVSLPELRRATGGKSDCCFKVLPAGTEFAGKFEWFHHFLGEDNEPWLSLAFDRENYLLRFPDRGDFLISRDGKTVQCIPLPGTPEVTIRHLLLDQIIPLILSNSESLVLHASAVLAPDGVIGFVGKSGRGKSTLAASFGHYGYPLISDDYLLLRKTAGDWIVIPSYPGVRLWPETSEIIFGAEPEDAEIAHYTRKRRVTDPALIPFAEKPSLLRSLYIIDSENDALSDPAIASLSPKDVFMKLLASAFTLDFRDKKLLQQQFAAVGHLLSRRPCFRLTYARDFSVIPKVRQLVINHESKSTA